MDTIAFKTLDNLPLFATDLEIAVAIVGKANASRWKRERLPTLAAKHGFPPIDAFHGGRPVPLVRKFYEAYFGITAGFAMAKPHGEEQAWLGKRVLKKIDDEERRRANGEDVPDQNYGIEDAKKLKTVAEYRAKKAAEFAARKNGR